MILTIAVKQPKHLLDCFYPQIRPDKGSTRADRYEIADKMVLVYELFIAQSAFGAREIE